MHVRWHAMVSLCVVKARLLLTAAWHVGRAGCDGNPPATATASSAMGQGCECEHTAAGPERW